jgi:hypothetical protein
MIVGRPSISGRLARSKIRMAISLDRDPSEPGIVRDSVATDREGVA